MAERHALSVTSSFTFAPRHSFDKVVPLATVTPGVPDTVAPGVPDTTSPALPLNTNLFPSGSGDYLPRTDSTRENLPSNTSPDEEPMAASTAVVTAKMSNSPTPNFHSIAEESVEESAPVDIPMEECTMGLGLLPAPMCKASPFFFLLKVIAHTFQQRTAPPPTPSKLLTTNKVSCPMETTTAGILRTVLLHRTLPKTPGRAGPIPDRPLWRCHLGSTLYVLTQSKPFSAYRTRTTKLLTHPPIYIIKWKISTGVREMTMSHPEVVFRSEPLSRGFKTQMASLEPNTHRLSPQTDIYTYLLAKSTLPLRTLGPPTSLQTRAATWVPGMPLLLHPPSPQAITP